MSAEEWRSVHGFEGLYEVSNQGRVLSLPSRTWPTRRIIAQVRNVNRGGYLYVTLRKNGKQFSRKVHQLVCESFNGPRPEGAITRHLDGNPLNNIPSNLAWGTHSENLADAVAHGTHWAASKTHCKRDHPLSGENLGINKTTGGRFCKSCARQTKTKWQQKRES